jgi:hypothetical protein
MMELRPPDRMGHLDVKYALFHACCLGMFGDDRPYSRFPTGDGLSFPKAILKRIRQSSSG